MSKIIDLNAHRPNAHVTGPAVCVSCKHEWVATQAVREHSDTLECPACGLMRGTWAGFTLQTGMVWECRLNDCGNTFFEIGPDVVLCIRCGNEWNWSELGHELPDWE